MSLFLYNTLSRKKEEFKPIGETVGLYTCGPTVYDYPHIGNLRTYIFEDLLKRTLLYNDYKVQHVMNVTDVGHLTGDRDMGEDKMEQSALSQKKTAWEVADFYLEIFKKDLTTLNVLPPDTWCKATDYIDEQVDLIKELEAKGFTYQTSDGVYFDITKFPEYNKLSHLKLDELKEGARVEKNPEKKNPTDFALWKFSPRSTDRGKPVQKRQMEWESPWGLGFPGWHIECSAMSLKFLSDKLDIHCGGVDHVNVHHTNEIAQSEAVTGRPFFNYWLHGEFMMINGEKMSKSKGNIITLKQAISKTSVSPLVFRYQCLLTHYRKIMDYTEKSLQQAANALDGLRRDIISLSVEPTKVDKTFQEQFRKAINDDLNMPQAIAVLHAVLKSNLPAEIKRATVEDFDKVLGLNLVPPIVPRDVVDLISKRYKARENKDWEEADKLRTQIEKKGYTVEDALDGPRIFKK